MLAAGTKDGLVVFWRFIGAPSAPAGEEVEAASAWVPVTTTELTAGVQHLVWGPRPALLAAGFATGATVLLETAFYRKVCSVGIQLLLERLVTAKSSRGMDVNRYARVLAAFSAVRISCRYRLLNTQFQSSMVNPKQGLLSARAFVSLAQITPANTWWFGLARRLKSTRLHRSNLAATCAPLPRTLL